MDWGKTIEIDENTVEEGKITEATTELVAKTIEPVAGNNFPVALAPNLTIREGRNRHAPVWLADSGEGYEKKGSEEMVYKLQKALYGLKQAPRTWFSRIESYFIKEGFKSSSSEQTLFIKRKGGKILIVSIYVDDFLFIGDQMKNYWTSINVP